MITLVPSPYSGTAESTGPVMVIGFSDQNHVLVVDGDGNLLEMPMDRVRIDWRYDWRAATWVDVGPYEEIDDDEEATNDRGEEVSGDLPDVDGADGGREGDGQD